ncbi:MAG TPA: FkbM family methyltransferase [Candidatus Babeliales bacterium]|nr:MAG: hypothetical protein A3F67_01015 [Verrucomicrobia bacterium RIFCSPHIGHO2_12_FULL_41_10]HLB40600.1 FkbM family methyltransferase [Candidatus Babeliales bacterium]
MKYAQSIAKQLFLLCYGAFFSTLCLAKVYVHHTYLDPQISHKLVAKHLPTNPIILEAGAFDGTDTLILKKLWPHSTVYAFEPHPSIYLDLAKKVAGVDGIYAYELGLANRDGNAMFYESTENGKPFMSGSLIEPKEHLKHAPSVLFKNQIAIKVATIDSWAKQQHLDHIDFMWLDLQGSELEVMQAAPQIMQTVKALMVEVEFVEAYKAQPQYLAVRHWLEGQGFELVATDFADYNSAKPKGKAACHWFGNILMVRK